jgi:hypothetical protein
MPKGAMDFNEHHSAADEAEDDVVNPFVPSTNTNDHT